MAYEYELPKVGDCPSWLADDDLVQMLWDDDDFWYSHWTEWKDVVCKERLVAIKLEDDHWAVPVLKADMTPCTDKPSDFEGGRVMWSNGRTSHENGTLHILYWVRERNQFVIGYEKPLEGGPTDEVYVGCSNDPDFVEEMVNVVHKFASDDYKDNFGPLWTEVRNLSKQLQRAELKKKYLVKFTSEWGEGWNAAVEDIINDLV